MRMTEQQNQLFTMRMNEALDKQIMSWDKDLRIWYGTAIKALEFASPVSLGLQSSHFGLLLATEPVGLNMNVVMVLARNMEQVTPAQMEQDVESWGRMLFLNSQIQERWNIMTEPTRKKILKEIELMVPTKRIIGGSN